MFLALVVVVSFAASTTAFRLPERSREASRRGADCLHLIRDRSLDDDTKARLLQRHAVQLFAIMGVFLLVGLIALGVPLLIIWALDRAGAASLDEVFEILGDPLFLLGTAVVAVLGLFIARR